MIRLRCRSRTSRADSWRRDELSPSSTESDFVAPRPTRASVLALFVTLFALWLLWSGHYTVDLAALFAVEEAGHGTPAEHEAVNTLLLILGLASCVGVVVLCRRMGIVDNETIPVHLAPRLLRYAPWLAWQVVLANSITLTPGTVTIDVTGSVFTVHALTPTAADGLYDGDMDREVARLEGLG